MKEQIEQRVAQLKEKRSEAVEQIAAAYQMREKAERAIGNIDAMLNALNFEEAAA